MLCMRMYLMVVVMTKIVHKTVKDKYRVRAKNPRWHNKNVYEHKLQC